MTKEQTDHLKLKVDELYHLKDGSQYPEFLKTAKEANEFAHSVLNLIIYNTKLQEALENIRDLKYPYDDNSPSGYARRILEEIETE